MPKMGLKSAVLEWLLMVMLFADACFSYLITIFASYCDLKIPCLLCSRLEHVLCKEKTGFFWDMICENHKVEISSLVLCRANDKKFDGSTHSCITSSTTQHDPLSEKKALGSDISCHVEDDIGVSTTAELTALSETPLSNLVETLIDVPADTKEMPGGDAMKNSFAGNGLESKVTKDSNMSIEMDSDSSNPFSGKKLESKVKNDSSMSIEMDSDSNHVPEANSNGLQMSNNLDLGDAYKLAIGSTVRQLSGKLLQQNSFKDSTSVSEDLKLLLSQISASRGFELQYLNGDEHKTLDASTSAGMQLLQKRISLSRNESGLSLEGSTVSEIEGESVADRLKRQVEHDRKLLSSLYKELEEERNASAVAINQAMAMITKLQEEKAALQMEALQCLRMMEEKAEYDGEALQTANDLLADKEKEIQDLEAELDFYRKRSENVSTFGDVKVPNHDL